MLKQGIINCSKAHNIRFSLFYKLITSSCHCLQHGSNIFSGVLQGIVTSRDIDFLEGRGNDQKLSAVMTPFKDLVTAQEGCSLKEANQVSIVNFADKISASLISFINNHDKMK